MVVMTLMCLDVELCTFVCFAVLQFLHSQAGFQYHAHNNMVLIELPIVLHGCAMLNKYPYNMSLCHTSSA
jgi:hypothetical protein